MTISTFSLVHETPPAEPLDAAAHFGDKLSFETDPADVALDREKGRTDFVLIDARSSSDFAHERLPGAVSMPVRAITDRATAGLARDVTYVTYCWGPGCNGSTKAALRLAELGFRVKELIGGIEYWKSEGYPTERDGQ